MHARMSRTTKILVCFIFVSFLLGTIASRAINPTGTFYVSGGVYPGAPSYTVWAEGTDYFAKDKSGLMVASDTDIAALLTSVKALLPAYGGEIHLEAGIYNQYTTLMLGMTDENTTITGEGYKTTTRIMIQNNIHAINITGTNSTSLVNHIYLKNLKIKAEVGMSSTKAAIFLKWVGGSKFENIAIDRMGFGFNSLTPGVPNLISQCIFETVSLYQIVKSGLVVQDSYDCRFHNVYVLDCQGSYLASEAGIKSIHSYGGDVFDSCLSLNGESHGITISESASWTSLINTISDNNAGHQIYISYSVGTQCANCWGSTSTGANTYGLIIDYSNDTVVTNGQFRTNAAHGICVSHSLGTAISNSIAVSNGQVNDGHGISLAYAGGTIITGCILSNRIAIGFVANSQDRGINEDLNTDYTIVIGCDTRGNTVSGITLNGANSKVNLSWNLAVWVP